MKRLFLLSAFLFLISKIYDLISKIYVYAASVDLGPITGVGKFQEDVTTDPGSTLESFISTIVGVLTVIAGLAFLLYFLLGGLTWITAGGDKNNTAKAQKQMTDAAIGLIIVVVAYFIAGVVGTVLGLDILNPAQLLLQSIQ